MLGLIIGTLTYQGLVAAAGIVLSFFPILGVLDMWAGRIYRGKIGANDWVHLVTGLGFGAAGIWVLRSV